MIKQLLALLLLLPSLAFGQAVNKGASHLWETAAFGDVPGITHVYLNGYSAGVTTTFELVWPEGTAYTFLASNMSIPYIASTDTDDDAGDTGALTVSVTCVDQNFAITGPVTYALDGQTSVPLTQECMAVQDFKVLTAGSSLSNEGILRVGTGTNTSGVPAVVHAHIAIGESISKSFMRNVPAGYSMICRNFQTFLGNTSAIAGTFVVESIINKTLKKRHIQTYATYASHTPTLGYLYFPEKSQVYGMGLMASGSGPVSFIMDCLMIENAWEDSAQGIF